MIEIKKKSECCGCYGCTNVCPKQCIDMNIDNEGFWYPKVNKDICIGCGLCEKVCPVISETKKEEFNTKAYACKNKNEKVRLSSSSGGVFTNLCEYVIKNNGVVFGAGFNENFEVEHSEATTIEECEKFRGSKYVQSKIGNTYNHAKRYLDEGKIVLFSGTQCQIKGLSLYLKKKYKSLILVDIICHGVPSPLVFDLYKTNLKKKYNSDIERIGFREKDKGWKEFSYETKFKNGERYIKTLHEDTYMKGFLKDLYLRPSCYECKAKNFTNNSDISLADYWGVQNKHSEFDDDKGISLILVNSKKGQEIFYKIDDNMEIVETDLDYATSYNPCIVKSVKYNQERDRFFKKLNGNNLNELIEKNIKVSMSKKIILKIESILSRIK
ncbi:Coenzyme F420 hydrogenase/dehydrogenase, beta subunit C-terminal domain [Terrisporobacter vanillatitrophus]|uniref:Coenzyme F420 hydrogenase/dehydrogenase, beta subunit C-terminal domain n=1 Tax=Terrisporobacter vanillatitrophus TaxID=3058402 RepID=UPI003367D82E